MCILIGVVGRLVLSGAVGRDFVFWFGACWFVLLRGVGDVVDLWMCVNSVDLVFIFIIWWFTYCL